MVIELITNGALPKPAKCISCGYGGTDRWYLRFNAFIPRLGQILLCVAKYPSEDNTGCLNEAARRFGVSFMDRRDVEEILEANYRLQEENDRLELATERFTDSFAMLVANFLDNIKSVKKTEPADSSTSGHSEQVSTDGIEPNSVRAS